MLLTADAGTHIMWQFSFGPPLRSSARAANGLGAPGTHSGVEADAARAAERVLEWRGPARVAVKIGVGATSQLAIGWCSAGFRARRTSAPRRARSGRTERSRVGTCVLAWKTSDVEPSATANRRSSDLRMNLKFRAEPIADEDPVAVALGQERDRVGLHDRVLLAAIRLAELAVVALQDHRAAALSGRPARRRIRSVGAGA